MIDPSAALRQGLLGVGRKDSVRQAIEHASVGRTMAWRFVAGESADDCVERIADLVSDRRTATAAYLAEEPGDAAQAGRNRDIHLRLLRALRECDLTTDAVAEVNLRLSDLGLALPSDGARIALDNARQVCESAARAGTVVTVDSADHTTTDAILDVVRELRADFPWVGVALPAQLRRTEADCRDLASEGSRVRLWKGDEPEPESVAFQGGHDVGLAYVRCLKVLMAGAGHPMIATHDPDIVDIARSLSGKERRAPESFEFQMRLGVRPDEQQRVIDAGLRLRVHVPYGEQWYPYLARRIAVHPSRALSFLRFPKG